MLRRLPYTFVMAAVVTGAILFTAGPILAAPRGGGAGRGNGGYYGGRGYNGGYYGGRGYGGGYYPGYYGYGLGGLGVGGYGIGRGYYNNGYYNNGYYDSNGYDSGYDPAYYSQSDTIPQPQPMALTDSDVLFSVLVPANATVWFNGDKTTQTGQARDFHSADLTPGQNYTYTIRAQWMENGQMVDRTKKVRVTGGERRTVNFMAS